MHHRKRNLGQKCAMADRRAAFTLLESLAVMSIIALVLAATIPAVSGIVKSASRRGAIDQLMAAFDRARALAITEGRPSYVVFSGTDAATDAEHRCRAFCICADGSDPAQPAAPVCITAACLLPAGFCLNSAAAASVFNSPPEPSSPVFPVPWPCDAAELKYLKFGPTGAVLYPADSAHACVSLFSGGADAYGKLVSNDKAQTDANRALIKVALFTGRPKCIDLNAEQASAK